MCVCVLASHPQAASDGSDSEEDPQEAERRAARAATIAQEVKKHLTSILLEVTDTLFGGSHMQAFYICA